MRYMLIKETIQDETLGNYETFGIENENGYKISDVSTDIKEAQKILSIVNAKKTPENYLHYEIDKIFAEI